MTERPSSTPATDELAMPWRSLAALGLGVFAVATGGYVFVGVLDPLARDLEVSVQLAGQLATVFALTRAVGSPLLVGATVRLPRRGLLLGALATFVLAQLLAVYVDSFEALVATRVMAALGAAVYGPVALATAASLVHPSRRGRALSAVAGGLGAAFIVGIPVGTLLGGAFGWRTSFGFAGGLGIFALAAIRLGLPRVAPSSGVKSNLGVRGLPSHAGFWLALAITVVGFASAFVIVAFVGPLVSLLTGSASTGIGTTQLAVGVGAVAGIAVGGQAADRRSPARALSVAFGLLAVGHFALSAVPALPHAAGLAYGATTAALFVGAMAGFAMIPLQQVRLLRLAPQAPELALAANGSAVFLGQGLGAALGGAASGAFGLTALGATSGAIALCGLALVILSRARSSEEMVAPCSTP